MQLTTAVRRTTILLLWTLALWNAWECRGLFSDGSQFLVEALHRGWFWAPDDKARDYAIGATQIPLLLGALLGLDDLKWLARLSSLGLFGLPTLLYQVALTRAKDDAVLLAAVVAAIALVFMTTSFFIIGEYNTGFALTLASAIWILTLDRTRVLDGIILAAFALLSVRTYETFLVFGPVLAAMLVFLGPSDATVRRRLLIGAPIAAAALALLGAGTLLATIAILIASAGLLAWRLPRARPVLADSLPLVAAALFLAAAIVAAASCNSAHIGSSYIAHVLRSALTAWRHVPLMLMAAATLAIVAVALARPAALLTNRLYLCAGLPLILLALSPFAEWAYDDYPALTAEHYLVRAIVAVILVGIVGIITARQTDFAGALAIFRALGTSAAARRCLLFFSAMLLATLPSTISSTLTWVAFLDTARTTMQARSGEIPYDEMPASMTRLYWFGEDVEFLGTLSLALRSHPDDGMFAYPPGALRKPLHDLGGYLWRR